MSLIDQADRLLMDHKQPVHTPAPWRVFELPHTAHSPEDSPAHRYKHIEGGDGPVNGFALTGYLKPADASLIEAAPDLAEALSEDAAGRPFAELLDQVARYLNDCGGGPMADCVRQKAEQVRAALAKAGL
jgi:hypothetical protein